MTSHRRTAFRSTDSTLLAPTPSPSRSTVISPATHIARGCALLGFELMVNFRQPYLAITPTSGAAGTSACQLAARLPLHPSRRQPRKRIFTLRNLILTMLLGGLWHGASWNFVIWGLYQGGLLVFQRAWGEFVRAPVAGKRDSAWSHALKVIGMFQLTCVGWLIFRASSFTQIVAVPGPDRNRPARDARGGAAPVRRRAVCRPWSGPSKHTSAISDDPRTPAATGTAASAPSSSPSIARRHLLYLAAPAGADFIYFQF